MPGPGEESFIPFTPAPRKPKQMGQPTPDDPVELLSPEVICELMKRCAPIQAAPVGQGGFISGGGKGAIGDSGPQGSQGFQGPAVALGITGSGAAPQVAYFDGPTSIKGEGAFTYDEGNDALTVGVARFHSRGTSNTFVGQGAGLCDLGLTAFKWNNGWFVNVRITADNGLIFTGQTSAAGASVGTLNNAPSAGDPAFWLRVQINGANRFIPSWA